MCLSVAKREVEDSGLLHKDTSLTQFKLKKYFSCFVFCHLIFDVCIHFLFFWSQKSSLGWELRTLMNGELSHSSTRCNYKNICSASKHFSTSNISDLVWCGASSRRPWKKQKLESICLHHILGIIQAESEKKITAQISQTTVLNDKFLFQKIPRTSDTGPRSHWAATNV